MAYQKCVSNVIMSLKKYPNELWNKYDKDYDEC